MDQATDCAACNRGELVRTKVRRMGGALVFVGFVLLLPSLLGFAVGVLGMLGGGMLASHAGKPPEQVESELRAAGVPDPMIERLLAGELPARDELATLGQKQLLAVQKGQLALVSNDVSPGTVVGGSSVIAVVSLVGALLGWLLIRKKPALRCSHCGTVAPAA